MNINIKFENVKNKELFFERLSDLITEEHLFTDWSEEINDFND